MHTCVTWDRHGRLYRADAAVEIGAHANVVRYVAGAVHTQRLVRVEIVEGLSGPSSGHVSTADGSFDDCQVGGVTDEKLRLAKTVKSGVHTVFAEALGGGANVKFGG